MESWIALGGVLISTGGAFVIAWITTRKPSDLRQADWLSALIEGMPIGSERDMASDLRDGLVSRWSVMRLYPRTRRQRRRHGLFVAMVVGYVGMILSFSAAVGLSGITTTSPVDAGILRVFVSTLIASGVVFLAAAIVFAVSFLLVGEAKNDELAMRRRMAKEIYGLGDDPWTRFETVFEEVQSTETSPRRD